MRLGIFATHPIQYQVPIWRRLSKVIENDVTVFYFSDHGIRLGTDPGFGIQVKWDIDLLSGYNSVFLSRNIDFRYPGSIKIEDVDLIMNHGKFDWVYISGYMHGFERQIVKNKKKYNYRILMRGEFTDQLYDTNKSFLHKKIKKAMRDIYLKWFYRHVDSFGVIGLAAEWHLKRFGISSERLFSSPYNIDDEYFGSQINMYNRLSSRKELGIDNETITILFSGKLISRKAPILLLESLIQLTNKSKVVIILLGDGNQRSIIESSFRQHFGSHLFMPGFVNQSELCKYYAASDLFILPSEYDTWGLVVNEAMQFGLPVIVSDRVGCRHDLIIPGETGEIFQNGNSHDLAAKIDYFIKNQTEIRRMGQVARERIKGYTVEKAALGLLNAMSC